MVVLENIIVLSQFLTSEYKQGLEMQSIEFESHFNQLSMPAAYAFIDIFRGYLCYYN